MAPPSPQDRRTQDERSFRLAGAQWQDSLLQSYRMIHVTIQGFLITAGAAVLAVQLTSAIQKNDAHPIQVAVFSAVFTLLLGVLFLLQNRTATELRGVVDSRAEDVNHWHRLVILSENGFAPQQRPFTAFKRWQQLQRVNLEEIERELVAMPEASIEYATKLIGRGLGHTRKVIDHNLFDRLRRIWHAILASSLAITLWFVVIAAYQVWPR